MGLVAIDFEASCLPRHGRSFPIEVAICGPEGVRSWLITPHADWREWDWTDEAARLHRITRADLASEGQAPAIVFAELMRAIAGRRVLADSHLDADWFALLAQAAGSPVRARVEHAGLLLDEIGASAAHIDTARRFADRHCHAQHRAGPDARWLWCLLARLELIVPIRTPLRKAA